MAVHMKHATVTLALAAAMASSWAGCGAELEAPIPDQVTEASDGLIEILYRGRRRTAELRGGLVFIEGDIEVAPQELQLVTGEGAGDDVGSVQQAVRIQGAGYRWPHGVVPFELDGSLDATQQASINGAMDDWEDAVPGLRFVARTTANAASYPDYVRFVLATGCSSSIGRIGGRQWIRLTNGCINTFDLHHEIGHALGLYHQHSRKDRDKYVQIHWQNIQGCPDTATQRSDCGTCTTTNAASCGCTADQVTGGECDRSHNFEVDNARADLGSYDYDSIMHYGTNSFSKNGNAVITVLKNDPATGLPYVIGQTSHLSVRDVEGVRAMYPVIRTHGVVFRDTGNQTICYLGGREADVASQHFLYRSGLLFDLSLAPGGRISTNGLAEGDRIYTKCRIRSVFWAESYNYPNTAQTFDLGRYDAAAIETHEQGQFTVRVLNRGLIGVLTSAW